MNAELGVTIVVVTHDPLVSERVSRTIAIRDGRTATETLRRAAVSEAGEHHLVAEEYAVLDRVGRLQLPATTSTHSACNGGSAWCWRTTTSRSVTTTAMTPGGAR